MYAWFNLGTSYYGLGEYEKAKESFEKSQNIGWPKRMLWYQIQPVQTYNKLGLYQKAIDTANLGLWFNDNFAEMHYEKYLAYKGLGDLESSKIEAQKTKDLDPNFKFSD
jgi:tetratricopeptide (TPR) repeat protein